jgi:hypothetical protein
MQCVMNRFGAAQIRGDALSSHAARHSESADAGW